LILPTTLLDETPGRSGNTYGATKGSAAELTDICRKAEATGADSLWAVDHLFWPQPISESLTTLAIAAAATRRPTLGTCVLQLPLRHPASVAKQATALQLLSGGRFILGLGVGTHEGEYEQAGVDFHQRGHLMDEGIAALQRAWAGATDPDLTYRQEPDSPRVPIWIGGASPAALRRTATVGDGWVPLFVTAEEYGPALSTLRKKTEEAGRDPDAVEPGVVVFARVGRDGEAQERGGQWLSDLYGIPVKAFERHLVAGTSEMCATALARYVEAGARHIVIMVAGSNAVQHFGYLRSAFVAHTESHLSGVTG
jgi:alkanesulfonate monooxygenase SsuD/methylene tetrahydromethanopterin reductase-like flavin-dependent oxidoreductase (luciferase family)